MQTESHQKVAIRLKVLTKEANCMCNYHLVHRQHGKKNKISIKIPGFTIIMSHLKQTRKDSPDTNVESTHKKNQLTC